MIVGEGTNEIQRNVICRQLIKRGSVAPDMRSDEAVARSLLFVPGDREERYVKAAASGADGVICDLEDAVSEDHKVRARHAVARYPGRRRCGLGAGGPRLRR